MRILLFLGLCALAHADIFTAIADMQTMLGAEKEIVPVINRYIEAEKQRLDDLKKFTDEYIAKNSGDEGTANAQVTNPINAFKLIKRLTSEWSKVEDLMKANNGHDYLKTISDRRASNEAKFPTEEDYSGAAVALLRLQDVYNLTTKALADGFVNGQKIAEPLSAFEVFEIGRLAYVKFDYYHTLIWMQEALERIKNEDPPTIEEAEILEYLSYAFYQQGNTRHALHWVKRLVEISPNHPRAKGNVKWYKDALEEKKIVDRGALPPIQNKRPSFELQKERVEYEKLCRGETTPLSKAQQRKIHCYLKRDRPFLKLAPIKVEIVRYEPLVVLFKQVMSDNEIQQIQTLAKPRLRRATVQDPATGKLVHASYRISKSAWLEEWDDDVVKVINRRIEDMTNLKMDTAEALQVANYGLGGHYDPHYDMSTRDDRDSYDKSQGNRISTVLFYMSQPEIGGATVFNHLGNKCSASKHDALYWYNLYRNGDSDLRTRHAACPVLLGVKWVSNKWIHERAQEFVRPCGLDKDAAEHFVGDLYPYARTI